MSRYIDKDEVLEIVSNMTECDDDYVRITEWVRTMPSIDIVRCGECRYWAGNDNGDIDDWEECRWREDEAPDADDFCSYGERSEP